MPLLLDIHPEVRNALDKGAAVVALESTLISHGLPRPLNLLTALAAEEAVREAGAVGFGAGCVPQPPNAAWLQMGPKGVKFKFENPELLS